MHSDTLTYLAENNLFSIFGLVTFGVAFALVVMRVIRMDRKEIESMSNLPLDTTVQAINGDTKHE